MGSLYRLRFLSFVALSVLSGFLSTAEAADGSKRIVFLGDSLTAGYGLGQEFAYPELLKGALLEKGYAVDIVNAGVSGDTTAGGVRRVEWLLGKPVNVLVIALGANDSLRGLSVKAAKENLRTIIRKTRAKYKTAEILLAGIKAPPSMGEDYVKAFDAIYLDLEKEEGVKRIPFLLEGVAGEKELNLPDRLHPNKEGQRRMARHLLPFVVDALRP